MTVGELKKLIEHVSDEKRVLVERLDINGKPAGALCYDVDRTEALKKTFVLGIHL